MKQEIGVFMIVAHEKIFECLAQNFSHVELKIKFVGAYFFQRSNIDSSKQNCQLYE